MHQMRPEGPQRGIKQERLPPTQGRGARGDLEVLVAALEEVRVDQKAVGLRTSCQEGSGRRCSL